MSLASTSYWNQAIAHSNNLTTSQTYSSTNPYSSPTNGGGDYSFNMAFWWGNGTYECYMIDNGYTNYGMPNMGTWADSTNHITETVSVP